MSLLAIILVLLSSLLHASWNLISKQKTPSSAFFTFSTASSILFMLPLYIYFIPYLSTFPTGIWGFLLATGFFQAFYYAHLANSYRYTDITLSYPLFRSLPVLLVPLVCLLIDYGKPVTSLSLFGMIVITLGCLILPLTHVSKTFFKQYFQFPLHFVIFAALGTTGYSIVDSMGLGLLKDSVHSFSAIQISLFYIAFENLFILLFLLTHIAFSPREREAFHKIRKYFLKYPLMIGPVTTTAYFLVLLAMLFSTNVSYVVAFRQSSILIGVLLGFWILREKVTPFKIWGTLLIFTGLVFTAIG